MIFDEHVNYQVYPNTGCNIYAAESFQLTVGRSCQRRAAALTLAAKPNYKTDDKYPRAG